jgi:hypothetical protein
MRCFTWSTILWSSVFQLDFEIFRTIASFLVIIIFQSIPTFIIMHLHFVSAVIFVTSWLRCLQMCFYIQDLNHPTAHNTASLPPTKTKYSRCRSVWLYPARSNYDYVYKDLCVKLIVLFLLLGMDLTLRIEAEEVIKEVSYAVKSVQISSVLPNSIDLVYIVS